MLKRDLSFKNKFHFTSLGCARNWVDSEVMIGLLLKNGYECVEDTEQADYFVVNTCGFLEASRQEALDTIAELFEEGRDDAKVIIAGCMVQKHKDLLKERFPNIHYFLGSGDVEGILTAVQSEGQGEKLSSAKSYLEWGEVPRTVATQNYAYLKIAEGCKKRCSFCIIPTIKGPLKSKTDEQVLKEFRSLLSQDVKEVILIAQDLGDYGKDRKEKRALSDLLRKMLEVPGDYWIRLLYLYPDEIDDDLIAVIKSDHRICPYLDMPIQHINDSMLKAMHRKISWAQILGIIEKLRSALPEITIRTSLMVGFPSETEEQFHQLVDFVEEYQLDHVGVFSFSREKEAHAYQLPHQISEEIKAKRLELLMKAQQEVVKKKNQALIGKRFKVFVEGFHPESELLITARSQHQCPDIDGQIIINDPTGIDCFGDFYEVEITDTAEYDLIGKVVSKPHSKLVCI